MKGDNKTVKLCLDTDMEGPWDGCTLTPFVGAKWESNTNHVHTHAGLKFKSSLSDLGSFLGNWLAKDKIVEVKLKDCIWSFEFCLFTFYLKLSIFL